MNKGIEGKRNPMILPVSPITSIANTHSEDFAALKPMLPLALIQNQVDHIHPAKLLSRLQISQSAPKRICFIHDVIGISGVRSKRKQFINTH